MKVGVCGGELPRVVWSVREREGGPRSKVSADHELTPFLLLSWFSSQSGVTPPPGAGCREKLPERDKGVLLPIVGPSGAALQKEGPESGAVGAKGLWAPGRTSRTHPGSQAEAAEQVFGQEDLLVPRDSGGVGTDCVVPPAWAHRLHLSGVLWHWSRS